MRLSEHFDLTEMTFSETAVRHGISNAPPPAVVARLRLVAEQLEQLRVLLGAPIVITSGYRAPAVNALVGGSPSSAHVQGWAADVRSPFGTPLEVCRAIAASDVAFDQLIHEYGSWTHLSFDPRGRRQALTISHARGTEPGLEAI